MISLAHPLVMQGRECVQNVKNIAQFSTNLTHFMVPISDPESEMERASQTDLENGLSCLRQMNIFQTPPTNS